MAPPTKPPVKPTPAPAPEGDQARAMVPVVEIPTGFEGNSLAQIDVDKAGAGGLAAIAREGEELKAAIVVAKKFPRNELDSYTRLMKAVERPSLAAHALYVFPRGGQEIEGPSVDLAREAARLWKNIRYGLRIVSEDEERIHIKGWCLDLENNTYVEMEDKFKKLIYRKVGGWQKPDERDLRELMNRRGAICVRNAILQILPPDIIDDAQRAAKETKRKAAKGEIKQSRDEAARRIAQAFNEMGVTAEMLEKYLGHATSLINEEELVKLRGVYQSLVDGNSKREDYFDMAKPSTKAEGSIDMDDVKGVPLSDGPRERAAAKAAAAPPAKTTAPATADRKVNENEQLTIEGMKADFGIPDDDFYKYLADNFKAEYISDLFTSDAEKLMAWMKERGGK